MHESKREIIQEWFIAESCPVLVATVVFGIGIDKAHVRAVIHCDLPLSIENYYQEAGRARRDGQSAQSGSTVVVAISATTAPSSNDRSV